MNMQKHLTANTLARSVRIFTYERVFVPEMTMTTYMYDMSQPFPKTGTVAL